MLLPDASALLADDEHDQDELEALLGPKCAAGERIIKRFLRATTSTQEKVFPGSWVALYEELCIKLSLDIPNKATNKDRQEAILVCVSLSYFSE